MTLTIVEETRAITGGVDTHTDTHVAAALDPIGGLLGVREFAATPVGYTGLLGWLGGFGTTISSAAASLPTVSHTSPARSSSTLSSWKRETPSTR